MVLQMQSMHAVVYIYVSGLLAYMALAAEKFILIYEAIQHTVKICSALKQLKIQRRQRERHTDRERDRQRKGRDRERMTEGSFVIYRVYPSYTCLIRRH